jgi:hypothetical protein
MVTKKKSTGKQVETKGRVKVGKLKVNKETVKDLNPSQVKRIRAGVNKRGSTLGCSDLCTIQCTYTITTIA